MPAIICLLKKLYSYFFRFYESYWILSLQKMMIYFVSSPENWWITHKYSSDFDESHTPTAQKKTDK